ncbi:MAG: fused MFS/spermidine synthase [Myxococcota bacterium]
MVREPVRRSFTPALLLLFVGSGCAALIYEVVWFQLLRFVIGASMVSLGILLASFMGGMLLGSFFFDRFVPMGRHPLRVYAVLEAGIAAFGVLLPLTLPLVTTVYAPFAGYGFTNILFRGVVCALFLLPPAILMGATLPAVARWMETTRVGVSRLGFFYGANTAGGVMGTLLASFVLLRQYDVFVASGWAVALNLAVAAVALGIARLATHRPEPATPSQADVAAAPAAGIGEIGAGWVYLAIGVSGLTALGAQVVWTRLLSLLMGATVYTFSLILAVFLVGIGLGGALGGVVARRAPHVGAAFAVCQMLVMGSIAYAAWAIPTLLPDLHFVPVEVPWWKLRWNDLLRCAVAVLPATIWWGASFPIALGSMGLAQRDLGRMTGRIYAANTTGAILGSLMFSLGLVPWLGTRGAQQLLVGLAGLGALVILLPVLRRAWPAPPRFAAAALAGLLAVVLLGGFLGRGLPVLPEGLVTYGRSVADWGVEHDQFAFKEGMNATVATTREAESGLRNFHVSGKVVASTYPRDMRLERMLGHLPALMHPNPKSILVVGFGAGITAGVFTLYPEVESITIVEIEPDVPAMSGDFFGSENYRVLDDPRTRVVFDDARHFIATTDQTFDLITSDPIHPWVKGAAALYTLEYYELVKQRLNPGGVVTQWVPFYETSEPAVKSEIATFLSAFPHGTVWNTLEPGQGYDVTLLGQVGPARVSAREIQRRLDANPRVRASLSVVNIHSALDLLGAFAGQKSDMEGWLAEAQLNEDRNLRLEYLAGEALDLQIGDTIVRTMAHRLSYPTKLFEVTEEQERQLRESLRRHHR